MNKNEIGDFALNFRRQSVSDGVADRIRELIVSGSLEPGQRITEADISASFGVSRTPVREALRLLAGEGLVEPRTSGGFAVTSVRSSDVEGIYSVRSALEGLIAKDAAGRLNPEELAALEQIITNSFDSDVEKAVESNRAFHDFLENLSANSWVRTALKQINGHINRIRIIASHVEGRPAEAAAEHKLIFEAILKGDGKAAEARMREHIDKSTKSAIEVIKGL